MSFIKGSLDEIVEAVVATIKEQLLKQMHLMRHNNEYPSRAVPHATIVDMKPLVNQPIRTALEKFVVEGCDHPYHSVIGEGDLAKCLKCGQYCNEKGGDDEG